jgi:hypothetical protein
MYDGRLVETIDAEQADRGRIGLLMAGHAAEDS